MVKTIVENGEKQLAIVSPNIQNSDDIANLHKGLTNVLIAITSTDDELYMEARNGIAQVAILLQAIAPNAFDIEKHLSFVDKN